MLLQLAQMIERQTKSLSLMRGLAILSLVMCVAGGIVCGVVYQSHGLNGVAAGALAAALSLSAGGTALAITSLRSPNQASGANLVLLAMMVRLAIPLAAALVLLKQVDWLQDAAFAGQLVVLYLIMLATETWLSLHVAPSAQAIPAARATEKGPSHG